MHSVKDNHKYKVVVFDFPVIARDCAEAFANLGNEVIYVTEETLQDWKESLKENIPDILFTVNYQIWLSELAEEIQVPYISWIVDTPHTNLFYENNKGYRYTYQFIYEEDTVNRLTKLGFQRVYYLPVAVNIKRLSNIKLDNNDILGYHCDVSFLGNTCNHNEYTNLIKRHLILEEQQLVEQIIAAQMQTNEFIIPNIITEEFSNEVFKIAGIKVREEDFLGNLTAKDILSEFLGRYHTYIERTTMCRELSKSFNFNVYGEEAWRQELIQYPLNYKGEAEHYIEMPRIFKISKININVIRSFVASGLPMRVFDVLGSGGFLVTNSKRDIHKYFKDGKDLVVYRDVQDLKEIIRYYLNHEEERLEIAKNGFETVKEHNFENRIQQILTILEQNQMPLTK